MKITGKLIAVAIVLLAFTGCGQNKEKKSEEPAATETEEVTPETEEVVAETNNAVLTDGYWKLVVLKGKDVTGEEMQDEASLIFLKEESRVAGSNGCNRVGGFYTVGEDQMLSFSQLMNTQMACPPNDIEGPFMEVMETTESYRIEGDRLYLHNPSSAEPLAVFVLDPTKE